MTLRSVACLLTSIALASTPLAAQASGGFDKSRYLPGTLQEIVDRHAAEFGELKPQKPGAATFIITGDPFPSRVRLGYTGRSRPISTLRKQAILHYFKSWSQLQHADLYETEMLFREGEKEWWIPVQTALIPSFREEVREGGRPLVFLIWMGGVSDGKGPDWIFLIDEFEADE